MPVGEYHLVGSGGAPGKNEGKKDAVVDAVFRRGSPGDGRSRLQRGGVGCRTPGGGFRWIRGGTFSDAEDDVLATCSGKKKRIVDWLIG